MRELMNGDCVMQEEFSRTRAGLSNRREFTLWVIAFGVRQKQVSEVPFSA